MTKIVEINHLTKMYGKVKAVDDVSFYMESNKIYGLLGRNGAGKTTIMHLLTAQLFASEGQLKVFGEHPYENQSVLSQICFIKESQKYPDTYSVQDVLEISELLFPNWDSEYAHRLVADFRLPLKRRMKKLSRGMFSSVGIVIGLASRAPLTIFDEPYLGLDAVSRSLFYDRLIEDYGSHPRTIILSTHLIDEISEILEHVIVIDDGKLMIDEDAEELRGRAYTVTGQKSKVEKFTNGKKVIAQSPFGALLSATVMGQMEQASRKEYEAMGLEFAPISLQQLFIHLTNENQSKQREEIS